MYWLSLFCIGVILISEKKSPILALHWLCSFRILNCCVLWFQYAEKDFVCRREVDQLSVAQHMWESVSANDKKSVYHHIVTSSVDINITYGQTFTNSGLTIANTVLLQEQPTVLLDQTTICFQVILGTSLTLRALLVLQAQMRTETSWMNALKVFPYFTWLAGQQILEW